MVIFHSYVSLPEGTIIPSDQIHAQGPCLGLHPAPAHRGRRHAHAAGAVAGTTRAAAEGSGWLGCERGEGWKISRSFWWNSTNNKDFNGIKWGFMGIHLYLIGI